MGRFHISMHGRLQDWIAHENGYFADEGLDYELDVRMLENADQDIETPGAGEVRMGAYELYQVGGGGKQHLSCACHWAVNQAATDRAGRMWGKAYSVLPAGVYVGPGSAITRPEDLAGVEVAVGYHSGSHFATIQALEAYLEPGQISLRFGGMPYDRVDALLAGEVPAATIWSAPTYLVEQLGCRKLCDVTFMAGFMLDADTEPDDVERYFAALRRAQMELDLAPERYKHHYLKEMPARYVDRVDVRRFGQGERIVFLPYTPETYERTRAWLDERALFEGVAPAPSYETAVLG